MRASVWASTALVGSTSTRISAFASSARTSTSRCRCPPENERPRSSTISSRPAGSATRTSSAAATSIAVVISSSLARDHGSSSLRSVPEKISGSGSLTRIRRRTTSSGSRSSGVSPSITPQSSTRRPSRSASALVSSGEAETRQVRLPGSIVRPESGSTSGTPGGRLGQRLGGILDRALDGEHAQHLAGTDVRARELLHRLRRRPQRDHEEPRVPVERDELAGGDLPGGGEVRADPGDEHDEEPRQEHLGRVERRLRRGDADAGDAHALGALPVAVEEGLLAADAAQHAEAGGGVGAERGQEADLLALLPLPELERLDHEAERDREQRHADQDEEAERRRRS